MWWWFAKSCSAVSIMSAITKRIAECTQQKSRDKSYRRDRKLMFLWRVVSSVGPLLRQHLYLSIIWLRTPHAIVYQHGLMFRSWCSRIEPLYFLLFQRGTFRPRNLFRCGRSFCFQNGQRFVLAWTSSRCCRRCCPQCQWQPFRLLVVKGAWLSFFIQFLWLLRAGYCGWKTFPGVDLDTFVSCGVLSQ